MSGDNLDQMIREYEAVRVAYESVCAARDRARDEVLAQVREQLDAIDAEFLPAVGVAGQRLEEMTAAVKGAVIKSGQSYRGSHVEIRYASGRRTVKVAGVEGLIKRETDPIRKALLENLIEYGEPSATIRYL